jgi:hypothetical protein
MALFLAVGQVDENLGDAYISSSASCAQRLLTALLVSNEVLGFCTTASAFSVG